MGGRARRGRGGAGGDRPPRRCALEAHGLIGGQLHRRPRRRFARRRPACLDRHGRPDPARGRAVTRWHDRVHGAARAATSGRKPPHRSQRAAPATGRCPTRRAPPGDRRPSPCCARAAGRRAGAPRRRRGGARRPRHRRPGAARATQPAPRPPPPGVERAAVRTWCQAGAASRRCGATWRARDGTPRSGRRSRWPGDGRRSAVGPGGRRSARRSILRREPGRRVARTRPLRPALSGGAAGRDRRPQRCDGTGARRERTARGPGGRRAGQPRSARPAHHGGRQRRNRVPAPTAGTFGATTRFHGLRRRGRRRRRARGPPARQSIGQRAHRCDGCADDRMLGDRVRARSRRAGRRPALGDRPVGGREVRRRRGTWRRRDRTRHRARRRMALFRGPRPGRAGVGGHRRFGTAPTLHGGQHTVTGVPNGCRPGCRHRTQRARRRRCVARRRHRRLRVQRARRSHDGPPQTGGDRRLGHARHQRRRGRAARRRTDRRDASRRTNCSSTGIDTTHGRRSVLHHARRPPAPVIDRCCRAGTTGHAPQQIAHDRRGARTRRGHRGGSGPARRHRRRERAIVLPHLHGRLETRSAAGAHSLHGATEHAARGRRRRRAGGHHRVAACGLARRGDAVSIGSGRTKGDRHVGVCGPPRDHPRRACEALRDPDTVGRGTARAEVPSEGAGQRAARTHSGGGSPRPPTHHVVPGSNTSDHAANDATQRRESGSDVPGFEPMVSDLQFLGWDVGGADRERRPGPLHGERTVD